MIHGQSLPVWATGLPKTWTARRLKYDATFNDDKLPEDFPENADIDYIEISDVSQLRGVERFETVAFADAPSRARRTLKQGDTLLSTVRTYLKAVAFVDASVANSVASTGFAVVRPSQRFNPRFLSWVLQSDIFVNEVVSYSVGVSYPAINAIDIANLIAIQPPLLVQQAIAAHLDRETAKIDTLIAKKRELIAKLKEQRSALISRTVTRGLPPEAAQAAGLDPNPPMKDSGVEWLGEVPKHWSVVPLGYLVDMFGGGTPDKSNPDYWDGDIPWVSAKDMKTPFIQDSEDHISGIALASSAASLVPTGSILIVVRGMILLHTFPVALTLAEVAINQDMKALVCGASISPKFLFWAISGAANHLVASADEAAHGTKKIDTAVFKRLELAFPTIPEQVEVVKYLDNAVASLDLLLVKIETAITRLTEYRAALITATVTGQLDVR